MKLKLISVALVFLAITAWAEGNKVGPKRCTISWTASLSTPTAPVEGYKIFITKTRGQYNYTAPFVTTPATVTSITCPVIPTDGQYYAVARAYNTKGDSPNSNEAPFVYDSTPPAAIQ